MSFDHIFPYVFGLLIVVVAGSFLYKAIRHGGFKAAMFGARIERTVGEVQGAPRQIGTSSLRVHVLAAAGEVAPAVGLEFVAKTIASYQMLPFSLTRSETLKLIALLESAVVTPVAGQRRLTSS